jgi:hypothetical protein
MSGASRCISSRQIPPLYNLLHNTKRVRASGTNIFIIVHNKESLGLLSYHTDLQSYTQAIVLLTLKLGNA